MRKSLFLILVFSMIGMGAMAQRNKQYVSIGIKGGVNMPRIMYFNNDYLSRLPQAWKFTPTGGVFVDIPVGDYIAIAPEVDYVERGTDITYIHNSGAQIHYALSVRYADLRLPVEFRIPVERYIEPFLTIGAEGGMRLGGKIHIDRTDPIPLDATIDVGDVNMTLFHVGAFAGAGIRSLVSIGDFDLLLKLTATYHQGFLDTYTKEEKEESVHAVNVNAYKIAGSRLPQGIEVCVSIGIPLKPRADDACRSFARDRYRPHGDRRHLFGF